LKRDDLTYIKPRASALAPNCPECLVDTQQRRPIVTMGMMLRLILLASALVFPVFAGYAAETVTVYKSPS